MILDPFTWLLAVLLLGVAILYASVGHAGASGYLAVMALAGILPEVMKPTALALNILVASLASYKFIRAGWFRWQLLVPLAVASVPLAFLGGRLQLPEVYYKPLVGGVLLVAAARLLLTSRAEDPPTRPMSLPAALVAGGGIGLLSGLTGVGGGIFLSPLLLAARWADLKTTAAVSAVFILLNSVAGLLGFVTTAQFPAELPVWAVAAGVGGWIGAELGSRRLPSHRLRPLLGCVLVIAGVKLILLV